MQQAKGFIVVLLLVVFGSVALVAQHHTPPAKHSSRHTASKHQMTHHGASHKAGTSHGAYQRAHPRAN
jgi:hypothetical protein